MITTRAKSYLPLPTNVVKAIRDGAHVYAQIVLFDEQPYIPKSRDKHPVWREDDQGLWMLHKFNMKRRKYIPLDMTGVVCPVGRTGDVVGIKERFRVIGGIVEYEADSPPGEAWQPAESMPDEHVRLFLKVHEVRIMSPDSFSISEIKSIGIIPPDKEYMEGRAVNVKKFTHAHYGRFFQYFDKRYGREVYDRGDLFWYFTFSVVEGKPS